MDNQEADTLTGLFRIVGKARTEVDRLEQPWSIAERLGGFAIAAVLLGLLVIAGLLRPEPRGHGTHEQLGLPPCTFLTLFDMPCPSCGMTTSWSLLMHGQVAQAVRTNFGGVLLAIVAALAGVGFLLSAALGRWIVKPPSELTLLIAGLIWLSFTLVDWGWRIVSG